MSDSREGEEEDDELIARWGRNLHHADENKDGDDQIDCEQLQQQPWAPSEQKGKNKKEKDKKMNCNSNRRKMGAKANKFLSRFDKHLQDTKNKTTEAVARRSAPPFPYNGEDFGGSPSCCHCFLRPSIFPFSSSQIHIETAATAITPGAVNTAKPKRSSYYDILKSLIEKNEFYSPECNSHRDIPSSEAK